MRWIEENSPDVLCLQELKVEEDLFPREPFENAKYNISMNAQKTWNGVAVISKEKPLKVEKGFPDGFLDEQKRLITVEFPSFTVVNAYVPNGGDVTLDRFRDKLEFLDRMKDLVRARSSCGKLIVTGDFNVAPEADDVYDPQALEGKVCFHPEERRRLKNILSEGMEDVFRKFQPKGKAYSWWDYRAAAFRRNMGMRLDLVLLNPAASEAAEACEIDIEPRGWEKPSDHTPVVLTMKTD